MNRTMIDEKRDIHLPAVMVVDDEECIREAVYELLTAEGIDTLVADGCEQCLQHLRDGFTGVILMDVMMPGKNGWETIREIRENNFLAGSLMIVMLTALDSPDQQMEGLQEVVIDYITKPFDPELMITSVRNYLACLGQLQAGV